MHVQPRLSSRGLYEVDCCISVLAKAVPKTDKPSVPLPDMGDQPRIACGVFGAIDFKRQPVFPYVYWGLRAQNHRGHQSHGFLSYCDGDFHLHRRLDLVPRIKTDAIQEWFGRLPGHVGIGNVRYTTSGKSDEKSLMKGTQPVTASGDGLKMGVSFNGNVVNTLQLREEITREFPSFTCECDADLICHKLLIELAKDRDLRSAVGKCMEQIDGAFSVVGILKEGTLFGFKDPYGIRPLCLGHNRDKTIYAFSSETVGLDVNGLERDFEVEPGELVTISDGQVERERVHTSGRRALCAFEFAYFARPDSRFDESYVYEIRERFGRNLVRENQRIVKNADVILSLPETGDDAALGAHEESGLKWERASRRHRYVTERAFILLDRERYSTIEKKINILEPKVNGRRLIVIDDSIVRGDTTKAIVRRMRRMGVKKVYMFVTFPRIVGPCFYGIDMATYGQLIGAKHDPEEITEIIGAEAVRYQSLEGFVDATGFKREQLCLGCITGKYPTPFAQRIAEKMKKRFLSGCKETGRLYEAETLQKP